MTRHRLAGTYGVLAMLLGVFAPFATALAQEAPSLLAYGPNGVLAEALAFDILPGTTSTKIYDAQQMSDGRIVMVGDATLTGGGEAFLLLRLDNDDDRNLDPTFGGDGIVTVQFPNSQGLEPRDLTIDSNGRIIVVGAIAYGGTTYIVVFRLLSNGTLDTSFSGDGAASFIFGAGSAGTAVAMQGSKILIAAATANYAFGVIRLNSNGSVDTTFANNGSFETTFPDADKLAPYAIAVNTNESPWVYSFAVVGVAEVGSDRRFAIAYYYPNGALVPTFHNDGMRTINFSGDSAYAASALIDSSDRILMGGAANAGSSGFRFALARVTVNGWLDGNFDGDGTVTSNLVGGEEAIADITRNASGDILAFGSISPHSQEHTFVAARYNADGSLDTDFNGTGFVEYAWGSGGEHAAYGHLSSDGWVTLIGSYEW